MRLNRRSISIAVLLIAIAGISAWLMLHPRDPVYEGKTLTQWVDEYSAESLTNKFGAFQSAMGRNLRRKIREFDPSPVSALIRLLETKHPWLQKLYGYLITHDIRNRRAIDFVKGWPVKSMRPQTAATFLSYLGPDAEPAIPALMNAAAGTNEILASSALSALGAIHRQPDLVVPFLVKMTWNTNQSLALSALTAVRWYTERPHLVVPILIQALTNQASVSLRAVYAAQALPDFGANALAAIPALRQSATAGDIETRFYAADALDRIAPESSADASVPVYIRILETGNASHSVDTYLRLYRVGPPARSAVPILVEKASNKIVVDQLAAYVLKAIDPEAAARIWPTLLRTQMLLTNVSNQAEPETKEQLVAHVLPMKDDVIPYLIRRLKGTNTSYVAAIERRNAAWLLGELGAPARVAVPVLTAAASNSTSARAALMKIRGEPLAPLIDKLQATRVWGEWNEIAGMVADFGTNAEPAIPILISVMKDPGRTYIDVNTAAIVLGEIHRHPETCVPALIPLLGHPIPTVRKNALDALAKFGRDAKPAVPELIESLEDLEYGARVAATNALKQIDPEAAEKAGIK